MATSSISLSLNQVVMEVAETVADRARIRGFRPADVFLHCKRNQALKVALRMRTLTEYELRLRISTQLATRTFQGAPRFLRVTNERPGLWKAIDFCSAEEVMEAARNRSRHINSVAQQRAAIVATAERMFATGECFTEAWKQARAV